MWPLISQHNTQTGSRLRIGSAFYRKENRGPMEETSSWGLLPLWAHQHSFVGEEETERSVEEIKDVSFLLHWYRQSRNEIGGNTMAETDASFVWILHPKIALANFHSRGTDFSHYAFPIYHYHSDDAKRNLSIGFLHPDISLLQFTSGPATFFRMWPLISYTSHTYVSPCPLRFKIIIALE